MNVNQSLIRLQVGVRSLNVLQFNDLLLLCRVVRATPFVGLMAFLNLMQHRGLLHIALLLSVVAIGIGQGSKQVLVGRRCVGVHLQIILILLDL